MLVRTFLAVAALAALAAPLEAADRPNFLFVYTDDQRYDAISCVQKEQGDAGRFPWFKTPHMDRLAAEGIRFRNAFVVHALCSPSRACFLTGRYSHHHGVPNNYNEFPVASVTHASLLRGAGYATGYVGKWHMRNQSGQRPGFDWSASYLGQGRYTDATFQVNGQPTETKGWVDDVATDFALEFIEKNKDKPFSLVVGYKSPHGPFEPPPRLKDAFAGELVRPTPNFTHVPTFAGDGARPKDKPGATVPVNLNYFRCIAGVDENLGRLLDALDKWKLTENTVVVYASDNGFYLGEHGLADKRSAYDESLRIPLLVRYPKLVKASTVRDEMVLNIDLAPTFLDLAGVKVPAEMQGASWKPLFEGKAGARVKEWRDEFLYEYFEEVPPKVKPSGWGGYKTPTTLALRTETMKLIQYVGHPDWTEMFDLSADPYETKNLYGDADPIVAAKRTRLEKQLEQQKQKVGFRMPDLTIKAAPKKPVPK
jgi:arylsulfatase A-like enzyme